MPCQTLLGYIRIILKGARKEENAARTAELVLRLRTRGMVWCRPPSCKCIQYWLHEEPSYLEAFRFCQDTLRWFARKSTVEYASEEHPP
jgi:hypothetical protein